MPEVKQQNINEEKAYKQANYTLRNRNLKQALNTVSIYYVSLVNISAWHNYFKTSQNSSTTFLPTVARDQASNLRK